MNNIFQILNQIKNESSSNKKIEILKSNSNNEILKQYLFLGLSPDITFGIATLPEIVTEPPNLIQEELLNSFNKKQI